MVKRGNELGQLTKDQVEQRLESGDGDEPPLGFSRASDDVLKNRRILKVTRRPAAAASSSSAAAAAANSTGESPPKKGNPFAKVDLTKGTSAPGDGSFSSGSTKAPAAPAVTGGFAFGQSVAAPPAAFLFGQSSSPAPAPAAANSFSFGKVTSSASATSSSSSSGAGGGDKEAAKLCAKANRAFRDAVLGMPPSVTDAFIAVEKYKRFAICQMDKQAKTNPTTVGSSKPMGGSSSPNAPSALAPSFEGFASASMSSTAASAGSSSFSFGGAPSITSAPAAAPVPAGAETGEGADTDPDAAPDGIIQATVDPNWDDVVGFEHIGAFHLKDIKDTKSSFAKFAQGKMRVQKSKNGSSHRMLMRDKAGLKVLLNMAVSKEMQLKWSEVAKRKGIRPSGEITFYGTNKEERGYEFIRLLAPLRTSEDLHKKLWEVS
jgi:hypothetical protein